MFEDRCYLFVILSIMCVLFMCYYRSVFFYVYSNIEKETAPDASEE